MTNPTIHIQAEINIAAELQQVKSALCGRYVKLKKGWYYRYRKALITDIICDHDGKIKALAMVLKKDHQSRYTSEFLNDRSESRQYWKIDELEWL